MRLFLLLILYKECGIKNQFRRILSCQFKLCESMHLLQYNFMNLKIKILSIPKL